MFRELAGLFAAIGYALEALHRFRSGDDAPIAHAPAPIVMDEEEVDESELFAIAEIFERLSDRYLDEVRGWDALNGVLLGGIFALFVLFVDKVESFTWLPSVLLVVPALLTAWNFRGAVAYSPDPDLFEEAYQDDSANALANLIASHKENALSNGVLRNRKRFGFYRALAVLIVICLVAAGGKVYTQFEDFHEIKQAVPSGPRLLARAPCDCQAWSVRRDGRLRRAAP